MAAVLAGSGAWVALTALSPPPAGGREVPTVVAVRDLAAGAVVGRADVDLVDRPTGQRPASAVDSVDAVVGRTAAAPIEANDVVTTGRLLGGDLLAGQPPDHVAMSVPVVDASGAGARPGALVDLYATGTGERAATDVVVLAVREAAASGALGVTAPPHVTLSLGPSDAARVARSLSALDAGQSFVLAIRPPQSSSQ